MNKNWINNLRSRLNVSEILFKLVLWNCKETL